MDLRKLKTLIDLVSESNISELEITEAEGKVRIVKAAVVAPPFAPGMAAAPVTAAPAAQALPVAPSPAGATAAPEPEPAPAGTLIKSPMVGTFYRAASPGAKAFVEVGSEIKTGDPVCIIEAMKIMNEIESDITGRIVQVLCENGQAVEFGQPLFVVE
jgi:acetyl-CoA carboxylase biotin carboxyl carrier protein